MNILPKKPLHLIILIIAVTACYSFVRIITLNSKLIRLTDHLSLLESNLASTTAEINGAISKTRSDLSSALNQEQQTAANIAQNLGTYQQQVQSITGTVTTLQKLSKTDPELLQKYSKIFFLNEHYAPARLVEIPNTFRYSEAKVLKIHEQVWPHLQNILEDLAKQGYPTYVFSAFRSFNEQSALKNEYKVMYGAGSANSFSADQGYSEHQLGTTIDFIGPGQGGVLEGFDQTKSYEWLTANAYRYGFILSYPKGNGYYVYEPWHWRYVGVKLATYLHDNNKRFYDLDQRTIDGYLVDLFE